MSHDFFADTPLRLNTVCSRLREAVEERENFFKFDPQKTALSPLDLPSPPFNTADFSEFADNITSRIRTLARFAFAPDKLDKFSLFNPAPGTAGAELTLLEKENMNSILHSLALAPEDFWRHTPFRFTDMGFFNACAELLNSYILYPSPPRLDSDIDDVFIRDFYIKAEDLLSGTVTARRYLPDGVMIWYSSAGTRRFLDGFTPAQWQKDDYRISQPDQYFCYDVSRKTGYEAVELNGTFQFQLTAKWYSSADGKITRSAEHTTTYTLSAGGSTPLHIPGEWQQEIDRTLAGSSEFTRMQTGFSFDMQNMRIKLSKSNYPALPYKYLS